MFGKRSPADKLKALEASYLEALPGTLAELENAARPLFEGGSEDQTRAALNETRDRSHKLAGSAGTFGCGEVSEAAHTLEELVEFILDGGEAPTDGQLSDIESLLRQLAGYAPGDGETQAPAPTNAAETADQTRPIYVLVQGDLGPALARAIEDSARTVRLFANPEDVEETPGAVPRAILVHSAFPRGAELCRILTHNARQISGEEVPIIFLSRTSDLATRLRAVKAGAKDYVVEPIDGAEIVRRIDGFAGTRAFTPFRVLIVEDDGNLAVQCGKAFEGPGFATRIVEDPTTVLDSFRTFDPELIVLDVSLKNISGLDLAKVIWQRPDRQNTSIVFVTAGPELSRELLKLGVPDEYFVPRPLDTLALCALVTRHLHKVRAGREATNRIHLLECLDRAAVGAAAGAPDKKAAAARKARSQPEAAPRTTAKVLVVDDDEHIVEGIAIKLSSHGLDVLKAYSGEQAFDVAWREHPDLIISDYNMPKGTGEYLLARLKATAETRDIPVVILTGRRVGHNKDYALERDLCGRLGAVSYLSKPIKFDEMVRELRQFIQFPTAAADTRASGRSSKR